MPKPKSDPAAIESYIENARPESRDRLRAIRAAILEIAPTATERIGYGMPGYYLSHPIIHFAAQKKHIGIYPGPEALDAFAERCQGYVRTKGGLQIPDDQPLPLDLIRDIARYRLDLVTAAKAPD